MTETTKDLLARLGVRTFNDELPPEYGVVLCYYCGTALHDKEHDIYLEQEAKTHICAGMTQAKIDAQQAEIERLRAALSALMDLNDNHSPFGGEMYHDRIDRTWNNARKALEATP